jgi:Flp pilus assembly protein TadG
MTAAALTRFRTTGRPRIKNDIRRGVLGNDRGSGLVEFALIAFMFIMMLLAVVEMVRMVLVYTTVAFAARTGARYAIVHGADRTGTGTDAASGPGSTSQVESVVQNYAGAGLLDTSKLNINVSYPDSSNNPGARVLVTVTYVYDPLVGYFNSSLGVTLGSASEGVITY